MRKKIQFEKEKSNIRCSKSQLDFVKRLIKFMKGLIVKKN